MNYRSRPEVLAVVNHLFGADFGDEFQPLAAAGEFPDPVFGPPVELLVTDKSTLRRHGPALAPWRGTCNRTAHPRADRRRRRRRRARSSSSSPPAPTPSGTRRSCARSACRPTAATGRGYFGQQQVVDLLAYLRLLHNRYDDEALVTVLASPFVGVSNDALASCGAPHRSGRSSSALEHVLPARARPARRAAPAAFRQRYDRLTAALARLSLERLCERIVAEHDYDLAVLAQWDGRRRYANLRKLARLARSYEELRGPDVEGFVRFVRDQEAVGARSSRRSPRRKAPTPSAC